LREEFRAARLFRLGLEDIDEELADDLALGFGIADAFEAREEGAAGIDMDKRDVVGVAEKPDDLLRFALPHEAVVDKNAGQLLADRLMEENRGHGAVDAAGQSADH